jgi:DNA-binding response OmpR family regulator
MATDMAAPVLLYVEDEALIQEMLVDALEEAGFSVVTADDGEQAQEILASRSEERHGLITDVNLGDGPDGWDVARAGRELIAGLPVVYVSGASEHLWTSHGVPNSLMITKPFVAAQVVVAISSLLVVSE